MNSEVMSSLIGPVTGDAKTIAEHNLSSIASSLTALCQSWGGEVPASALQDFIMALHLKDREFSALLVLEKTSHSYLKGMVKSGGDGTTASALSAMESCAKAHQVVQRVRKDIGKK